MGGSLPYGTNDRGVRLAVRLTPKAGRAGFSGIAQGADGAAFVKAGVTAPAEGGKANRALIKLLARELRLPASAMHIASGAKARQKSIQIAGDPAQLKKRLELFCGEIK
ncbi:MAG: DUF167 family protein [Alphaproteobacteria bacterium]|jgi:hypothetical protein|nr:DUF167 family protein [Alphaproteobacteria bacterium]MDP6818491.1 DUF167 family protein [Alphaproteobacteria bacterium]|tara:strand:- start:430 stop:756 length:327 start_codon:yes stop_codon:yes gene_type:complete